MNKALFEKIKKQNGESFAKAIRNYHNGIFDIPDIAHIVRYAGREAEPIMAYLISLMGVKEIVPTASDPFTLLKQAGYDAFHADSLEKQNSIARYFTLRELLCTFNDAARFQRYHIVHAVRHDAETLKRSDFKGAEKREDAYGASVISIQMLKTGGFISIKNRYNHAVENSDNTFNSNPDAIIPGLSQALKDHFDVDFSAGASYLPEGFVVMGNQIVRYHFEYNNIYYGDQIWTHNGYISEIDRAAGDALFGHYRFYNGAKILQKIDGSMDDSFASDFNQCYGGNRALHVRNGNLMLGNDVLIGTEESRITSVSLPALTSMGEKSLFYADNLKRFHAPSLKVMGDRCLLKVHDLLEFNAPQLQEMGDGCLWEAYALTKLHIPALESIGNNSFGSVHELEKFEAPSLRYMGAGSLRHAQSLKRFEASQLRRVPEYIINQIISNPPLIPRGL